jgi:hypothetical protein
LKSDYLPLFALSWPCPEVLLQSSGILPPFLVQIAEMKHQNIEVSRFPGVLAAMMLHWIRNLIALLRIHKGSIKNLLPRVPFFSSGFIST